MASPARYVRSPRVIAREVDGEILLVPLRDRIVDLDDVLFVLPDPVAGRVWALLEEVRTLDELTAAVTEEFEVDAATAQADLLEFLEHLVRVQAAERREA